MLIYSFLMLIYSFWCWFIPFDADLFLFMLIYSSWCWLIDFDAGHSAGGAVGAYVAMMLEVRSAIKYLSTIKYGFYLFNLLNCTASITTMQQHQLLNGALMRFAATAIRTFLCNPHYPYIYPLKPKGFLNSTETTLMRNTERFVGSFSGCVHCITLGPPPCVSRAVVPRFVSSVICGDDAVPRASPESLANTKKRVPYTTIPFSVIL